MNMFLSILALLVVGAVALLFTLGWASKSGQAPGLTEGKLNPCPASPNCVCSEHNSDVKHYVEPIAVAGPIEPDTLRLLKVIVQDLGGTVTVETETYLATTFTSAVFGFVDDVELRVVPAENVVHVRSASRVGHGDGGVNRKRVQLIKEHFLIAQ